MLVSYLLVSYLLVSYLLVSYLLVSCLKLRLCRHPHWVAAAEEVKVNPFWSL